MYCYSKQFWFYLNAPSANQINRTELLMRWKVVCWLCFTASVMRLILYMYSRCLETLGLFGSLFPHFVFAISCPWSSGTVRISWSPFVSQASQLGVYKAFVDNYKMAVETVEKCSQSNSQFQKISEVCALIGILLVPSPSVSLHPFCGRLSLHFKSKQCVQ